MAERTCQACLRPGSSRGRQGKLMLSELLFLMLMVGSLVAVIASISYSTIMKFRSMDHGAAARESKDRSQLAGYLARVPDTGAAAPAATAARRGASRGMDADDDSAPDAGGSADPDGGADAHGAPPGTAAGRRGPGRAGGRMPPAGGAAASATMAKERLTTTLLGPVSASPAAMPPMPGSAEAPASESAQASPAVPARRRQGRAPSPSRVNDRTADNRSVFVPSRLGLALRRRAADVWTTWPDVHQRRIVGTEGVALLTQAFDLVGRTRASGITDDLTRKGIRIGFGTAKEFSGAIAHFRYSTTSGPPGAPERLPEILFSPLLLRESPQALAAALVHEGTHFQQFLDGTLLSPEQVAHEAEVAARWNEAVVWDEIRADCWPIDTPLEREQEFGYRTVLRGESALRDLLRSLL